MFNFQLFDDTGSTKRRFTGGREREQICRQVKVLSSQQRISPEGSQTDSQPKLEGQIIDTMEMVKCYPFPPTISLPEVRSNILNSPNNFRQVIRIKGKKLIRG